MQKADRQRRIDELRHYSRLIERQAGHAVRPFREDGFVNLVNKYGTSKDSTEQYKFQKEPIVPDDILTSFYEGNGLFARVIDAPADECVKKGFELEGIKDEKINKFYREALGELEWEENISTAIKWARLFGGSIVVMLINDGRGLDEPLDWENIHSIDDLRVFDRSLVQPDYLSMFAYEANDPFRTRGSRLGKPEYYDVFSRYGTFRVHDSRCLVFQNGVLPEKTTNSEYQIWGMPEYVRIQRAIRDTEVAHGSAVKLLDRSIQAVYSMKDLAAELATEEGEDRVLKRIQLIDMARGLLNSIVIDSEGEGYDFRQFSYTGVSQVIDTTCNYLSAVTGIPQTILFGRSPAGMNSTGYGDLENWYNMVERMQRRMVKKNLRYLLSVLFQAGLYTKEIDEIPEINIKFNPLWSSTEQEEVALEQQRATTAQVRAQTAQAYVDMQVLDPSEVRKKLAESEEFDVETMLDDYTPKELEENAPKGEPEGGDPMGGMMGGMPGGEPSGMTGGAPEAPKPEAPKPEAPTPEAPKPELQKQPKIENAEVKHTKPSNVAELRKKTLEARHKDGGPGSGIEGHKTYHPEEERERQQRQQEIERNKREREAEERNRKYNVGNIDLANRPKVSSEKMAAAGYDTEPGSVSTVYSSYDFFWQGGEEGGKWVCVHYTPIMENGDVLSANDVYDYIASSAESGDVLGTDKNGKHLVMNVEDVPCSEQEIDEFMKGGKSSKALDEFMKKADQWDEDVHNAQAELYTEHDSDDDQKYDRELYGGVGVIVVDDGRILCGRRRDGGGLLCGPGGYIEGSETAEEAAIRETQEEFGITPWEIDFIGKGPVEKDGKEPAIFLCTSYGGTPRCTDHEMSSPRFLDLNTLSKSKSDMFVPFRNSLYLLSDILGFDFDKVKPDEEFRAENSNEPTYHDEKVIPAESLKDSFEIINKKSRMDERRGAVGVYVISDGKILTGVRKNGDGSTLLGGPGGHIEEGETPGQAAIRETQEEFGITPLELIPIGKGAKENGGLQPDLFLCVRFEGIPKCDDDEMTSPVFKDIEELENSQDRIYPPFANGLDQLKKMVFSEAK